MMKMLNSVLMIVQMIAVVIMIKYWFRKYRSMLKNKFNKKLRHYQVSKRKFKLLQSISTSSKKEELLKNFRKKSIMLNAISDNLLNLLLMKYPALYRENIYTLLLILKILEIYSQNKNTQLSTTTLLKKKSQNFG